MLGIDTRELDATSTELSFVLEREGYKGWPGMFEIVLNSMRCTSSKTSYMLIWSDMYLRLKEYPRKFWTVINSGVEDAYIGRLKGSFGKTIDLKNNLYLIVGLPLYVNILSFVHTVWVYCTVLM